MQHRGCHRAAATPANTLRLGLVLYLSRTGTPLNPEHDGSMMGSFGAHGALRSHVTAGTVGRKTVKQA
jgi:hypothetical protein